MGKIDEFLNKLNIFARVPKPSFEIICGKCGSKKCQIALLPKEKVDICTEERYSDYTDYGFICLKCGYASKCTDEQYPALYG